MGFVSSALLATTPTCTSRRRACSVHLVGERHCFTLHPRCHDDVCKYRWFGGAYCRIVLRLLREYWRERLGGDDFVHFPLFVL